MKKMLLFFFLIFPVFVNAVTYSSATTTAGSYMETGDFKYGFEKYVYTPTDNTSFYNNDFSLFKKGGMLSLEEFKITLKNNTRSLYYSYLYEGNPYWTITNGSSSDYRKIINGGFNEYKKTEISTKIGTKVTEYVIPTTSVIGQGTYNDPFLFAPQYKVLIKVNNGDRGVMVDESNNEVTSLEFLATESDYREIKIKSKSKYGYIGSTCGMILNDIQSSSGKIIISGVTRDTECTINFGEKPTSVTLDQSTNTTASNPNKLYIIPDNGWYSDEFANYSITTLISNPTKTGYTYKGYYKSTSVSNACSGTLVIGTDRKLIKTKSLLDSFVDGQTLYPCYEAKSYTISFDKNTGDRLTTTSKTVVFDQNYGDLPVPEKDGYKFDGWYTDAVSGELIESTTTMDVPNSHTVYAHWTAISTNYKVVHWLQNIGGGTEQNSTNYTKTTTTTHSGTSDTTVTAPRKTFAGFTQPASKTVTIDRHGTSVVNYYYTRNYYTISFNANGRGTPSFTSRNIQFGDNYELPTISATGYTFNGWYTAASGGTQVTSSNIIDNATNHTLYAQWTINKYTITLNKGTGITAVSGSGTYDYNSIRNINATVQAGYTWTRWTGYTSTTTMAYSFNMPAQNITLTATATGNPYSIIYNCNGGSGSAAATSHVYGTTSTVRTNFCSKVGSSFTKWNTAANGSGTSISSGGTVTTLTTSYNGSVSLYAQWTVNNYTVAYDCNGGTGSTASSSHTYGVYKNLTANGCSRTGHRFDGWTTNSGGTGTIYTNQQSVVNLTTSNNVTVTLYAKWTKCAAGTYLSGNTCATCPAGKYSTGGTNSCLTCNAGYYSASGSGSCSICPAGQYSSAGAGSCSTCSAGYYSAAGSSTCSACAAGKYSTAGSGSCSTCTAGYYCPGSSNRIQCSAGKYSASGASSCSTCSAGTYSAAGASTCSACPAGQYSAAGSSSCSTCTAGYYCPGGSNRIQCSAGKYSSAGASSCSTCSAGYYSAAGASTCSACAAGQYSTAGSSSCTTCTAGYYCPGSSNRIQCNAGTYAAAGASSCTSCSAGYYSAAGASTCTGCSAGQYSSAGASSCSTCPAGYKCPGSSTRIQCSAGTYAAAGSSSCSTCSAGYYSAAGATSCSACSAGQYSAAGASSCSTCTAGYYCPGATNRIACPAGKYSGAGASNCASCPAGQYTSTSGKSSCSTCAAGTYNSGTGNTGCTTCTAGYYCTGGANRVACSASYYSNAGATSCSLCSNGYYSTAGSGSCSLCPSGYQDGAAATSKSNCLNSISAGHYIKTANDVNGTGCPAGYYSNAHTVKYGSTSSCTQCPTGYRDGAGCSGQNYCTISLDDGQYIASAYSTTKSTCPAGTYKSAHSVRYGYTSSCSSCPSGYTSAAGSSSISNCYISVSAGKYLGTANGTTQSTCAAGTYKAAHTVYYGNTSSCNSCPSGTTSNAGATSSGSCYSLTPSTVAVGKSYFGQANGGVGSGWKGWATYTTHNSGYNNAGNQVYAQKFTAPSFSGTSKRLIFRMWGVRPNTSHPTTVTLRYAVTKESSVGLYLNKNTAVSDSNAIGSGYATYTNVASASGSANWIDVSVDVSGLVSGGSYVLMLWPYSTSTQLVVWQVGYHNGITLEYYK